MQRNTLVVIVVLVVIIVVAVVLTAKRSAGRSTIPVQFQGQQQVEKIDMKTLDVYKESPADWEGKYAPDDRGHYKNPKTGDYTVVNEMICASCGKVIPRPDVPADLVPKNRKQQGGASYGRALHDAMNKALADYMCPRCGKHAWFQAGAEHGI